MRNLIYALQLRIGRAESDLIPFELCFIRPEVPTHAFFSSFLLRVLFSPLSATLSFPLLVSNPHQPLSNATVIVLATQKVTSKSQKRTVCYRFVAVSEDMATPQRSATPSDRSAGFRQRVDGIRRGMEGAVAGVGASNGDTAAGMSVAIAQEHRLAGLVGAISRLEASVTAESAERIAATEALLAAFDERLAAAERRLEHQYHERVVKMGLAVDHMTGRIAELEAEVAAERDKNARLTRELMGRGAEDVEELKERLYEERSQREGAMEGLAAKVAAELDALNARLDAEHSIRERSCGELQGAVRDAARTRVAADERLLERIRLDIAKLAASIDAERQEREVGEEGLAATLEAIVQSL